LSHFIVWDGISDMLAENPQEPQNRAARVVTRASYYKRSTIRSELGWLSLKEMRQQHKAMMMFKVVNSWSSSYLLDMFPFNKILSDYSLRSAK